AYDVPLGDDVPEFRPGRHTLSIAASVAAVAMGVAFFAHSPSSSQRGGLGSLFHGAPQATTAERAAPADPVAAAAPVIPSAPSAPSPVANVAASGAAPAALSAAPASPPQAPRAPSAQVARSQITVMFSARPTDARIFLDGEALDGNPVTLQRSADDKRHRVRIEAPGYATVWRPIDLDRDVSREFELVPAAPSSAASQRTARPAEVREEPQKARRGRRALDRDDPWSL
ncbi:MAG: PEGA domain-containing protein, partial [Polyangiaceae bacterium]